MNSKIIIVVLAIFAVAYGQAPGINRNPQTLQVQSPGPSSNTAASGMNPQMLQVQPPSSNSNTGDSDTFCTQQYDPVCGSDGQTYSNDCTLSLAQKSNPDLSMAKKGEC